MVKVYYGSIYYVGGKYPCVAENEKLEICGQGKTPEEAAKKLFVMAKDVTAHLRESERCGVLAPHLKKQLKGLEKFLDIFNKKK